MKKLLSILLVAVVLLAGSHRASAQFRYGPTLGVDLTTLHFNQSLFDVDQSVGYQGGIMGELMFQGIGFGIDFGLQYTQRGATLDLGSRPVWATEGYGRERVYLHYIDIPIDLRFKWTRMNGLEDYIAPYVFGGPVISMLVAHNKVDAMEYPFGYLGLQAGVGFELWHNWQIQGSYTWGMTYAGRTRLLDDFSARSNTWSVRVNYLF